MFQLGLLCPLVVSMPLPEVPAPAVQPYLSLSDSLPAKDSTSTAAWRGGWYARASAGLVTTKDSQGPGNEVVNFDEGYLLGLAFGQRVNSGQGPLSVNIELEGLWSQQDASTTGALQAVEDVSVLAALLNLTVDFAFAERASVYVGGGVGPAWMDVGSSNGFQDDDGPFLAWQARAGLEWRFASNTAANLGYRFLNIDDNNVDDGIGNSSFGLETQQHVLEIGLRFGL